MSICFVLWYNYSIPLRNVKLSRCGFGQQRLPKDGLALLLQWMERQFWLSPYENPFTNTRKTAFCYHENATLLQDVAKAGDCLYKLRDMAAPTAKAENHSICLNMRQRIHSQQLIPVPQGLGTCPWPLPLQGGDVLSRMESL